MVVTRTIEFIEPNVAKLMEYNMSRRPFFLDMRCWRIKELEYNMPEGERVTISATLVQVECRGNEEGWEKKGEFSWPTE